MRGGGRLGVGQGQMVGDDVVQFPGDAHPLLGHPVAGLFLTSPLGMLGAGVHGVQVGVAHASRAAGGDRDQHVGDGGDRLEEDRVVERVEERGRGHQHDDRADAVEAGRPPVGEDRQPVDRHHGGGQHQHGEQIAQRIRGHGTERGHRDGRTRMAAAEQHARARVDGDDRGGPHSLLLGRVGEGDPGADQEEDKQRHDGHRVDDTGMVRDVTLDVDAHRFSPVEGRGPMLHDSPS